MATLKEFEDALRQHGMVNALAILDDLKKRDREKRSVAPARRVVGRKMTAELARTVIEMHATTGMTQQEIAFKLGVNQGRVNEVIKRGKWLNGDPGSPEALSRDKAMERLTQRARSRRSAAAGQSASAGQSGQAVQPQRMELESLQASVAVSPHDAKTVVSSTLELPREAEPELGLVKPDDAKVPPPPISARHPLRRPTEPSSAIVSAQLAFLDL